MISLTPALHEWVAAPAASDPLAKLKAAVRTHLGQFVKGEEIDDLDFMKRVEDRRLYAGEKFRSGVWSVRPDFTPKYRFFGAFFRPDWLVLFTKRERNSLQTDTAWHAQIDVVAAAWDNMLPYRQRLDGGVLTDFVTRNAEHNDDRW